MFESLNQIEAKYDELTRALSSPEVIGDSSRYQKTAKAHSEVAEIVEKYREYKDLTRGIEESKAMVAEEIRCRTARLCPGRAGASGRAAHSGRK